MSIDHFLLAIPTSSSINQLTSLQQCYISLLSPAFRLIRSEKDHTGPNVYPPVSQRNKLQEVSKLD